MVRVITPTLEKVGIAGPKIMLMQWQPIELIGRLSKEDSESIK